ncbi:hypothetical protein CXF78_10895 [Shewanella sp. 11B5]|uniref:hypothetical protein n=1 Tax=Shewanella sp. 11B5 TaxID=2058298 RepID=UPI000C79D741|nr:hypothetical protein [Shewanella sp. 11B5]PKI03808.1 hypothetical protein CXF78_10895 [Shewanella sp. 11B5]
MQDLNEVIVASDLKLTMKFASITKWVKVILAIGVVFAYFTDASWLKGILVTSVIVSLLLPLGFFDVFIQKLLEHNTQKLEERQIINATEANKHFDKLYKRESR